MSFEALDIRRTETESRLAVLAIAGELDAASVPTLRREVAALCSPGVTLRLDLRALSFVDSSALGFLLAASREATTAGWNLELIAPGGAPGHKLRRMKLDHVLPFVEDEGRPPATRASAAGGGEDEDGGVVVRGLG